MNNKDGAHSKAFDKIVDLAKKQKEYWDLKEKGDVDPNEVTEVGFANEKDELLIFFFLKGDFFAANRILYNGKYPLNVEWMNFLF